MIANKEALVRAKKKKMRVAKYTEVKELKGLEKVFIESSWGAELIDQLIKEENI